MTYLVGERIYKGDKLETTFTKFNSAEEACSFIDSSKFGHYVLYEQNPNGTFSWQFDDIRQFFETPLKYIKINDTCNSI